MATLMQKDVLLEGVFQALGYVISKDPNSEERKLLLNMKSEIYSSKPENEEKQLKQLEIFTEKEFNKAFNEVWKNIIENAQPNQSIPIGIVTGGLPGSGKSAFILEAREKLNRNIIAINGDEFRVYHPRFEKIVNLAKGDFPTYTGSFSGKMVEKVIEEAIKQRYNIIVEGTFRTADTPIKTLQSMKDNGYKTIVKIKAVNTEIAWQSTIDRFNEMKNNGLEPRAVNKLIFEKTADSLAENTEKVYKTGLVDRLEVSNRTTKLFDSRLGNINQLQNIIKQELGLLKQVSKIINNGMSK